MRAPDASDAANAPLGDRVAESTKHYLGAYLSGCPADAAATLARRFELWGGDQGAAGRSEFMLVWRTKPVRRQLVSGTFHCPGSKAALVTAMVDRRFGGGGNPVLVLAFGYITEVSRRI